MEALDYAPHISFVVFDDIESEEWFHVFDTAMAGLNPMSITFDRLGYFETPQSIILWAAPQLSENVLAIHRYIHGAVREESCRPNYRPGKWVPHCSLAYSVDLDRKVEAFDLVRSPIEPFEVRFDVADCVSFLPIQVLRERTLTSI